MKKILVCLIMAITMISLAIGDDSSDKFAVIVNAKNRAEITHRDLSGIFLGKTKVFPNKQRAAAFMSPLDSAIGMAFLGAILHKRPPQYKSHWMNMVFTGEGHPPQVLEDDAEMITMVASKKSAIGIIKLSSVNQNVRVVATF